MLFRVVFIATLMVFAILLKEPLEALSFVILCLFLLRLHGASLLLIGRSFRLMFWFFVPIILFHGLFTPGTYIQEPMVIPLSMEGLNHAMYLCLKMMAMFFSALLFLRILSAHEWLCLIEKQPKFADYLRPFVLLMPGIKDLVSKSIQTQKGMWLKLDNKWSKLPDMIANSMTLIMKSAKQEAHNLWLDWDVRSELHQQKVCKLWEVTRYDLAYGFTAIVGWVILWSV